MSTSFGQRVMQVSQETHSQIAALPRTSARLPIWIILMIRLGLCSMAKAVGHPAVHFRQW
jgi:hypothetical protein